MSGARSALLLLALQLSGCATGVSMVGWVVHPPRIPVRVFPSIIVVGGARPDERALAERLARHLGRSVPRVTVASHTHVQRLRGHPDVSSGTVMIELDLTLGERMTSQLRRRRELECLPDGECFEVQRARFEPTTLIDARVVLRVADARSGELLQREVIEAAAQSDDAVGSRARMLGRLERELRSAFDIHRERMDLRISPVGISEVDVALRAAGADGWSEVRLVLEGFVNSSAFSELPPERRARVWFDLGQARRFDEQLPLEERFTVARAALVRAVRLRPDRRYADALDVLEAHRRDAVLLVEQEAAREHNFSLSSRERTPPQSDATGSP